jgi:hypothetical protein
MLRLWYEAKQRRQITIAQIVGQGKRSDNQITCVCEEGRTTTDVVIAISNFYMSRLLKAQQVAHNSNR